MPMTDAFRNWLAQVAMNEGSPVYFDNSNAHIGVGDSNAVFAQSQTDLQGTNKIRKSMSAGFPTRTNNVLKFQARFLEADANFHWKEGAVFNAATGGVMMCRFLDDQGEKTDAEIWDYEVTVTLAHGSI